MSRRDVSGWVLSAAVFLLPPARREWGQAMRAELVGIAAPARRWRFTLGCVRVIVTRPAAWRYACYPLVTVAAVAATARATAGVEYRPLRWGLLAMVTILVLVAGLGRVRPLGPVAEGRAARGLRIFGYLLVGALAAGAVAFTARQNHHSVEGVPVLTVMFAGQLLGFAALTSRRSAAAGRTLIVGALAGAAAAAGWTAAVVAFPPIPPDVSLAVLATVLGMGVAVWLSRRREGEGAGIVAGTCAGTVAALLILHVVIVLSVFGPARLIPDLVPAALSPAEDVANSRIEIQDPYMWLLVLAWFCALGQCLAGLAIRRPDADDGEATLAWNARVRAVTTPGSAADGTGRGWAGDADWWAD